MAQRLLTDKTTIVDRKIEQFDAICPKMPIHSNTSQLARGPVVARHIIQLEIEHLKFLSRHNAGISIP